MSSTFASRALGTRERVLTDGRRVTIRHAVPSDAPRIAIAFETSRDATWGFDLVACDDHGAVVGHVRSTKDLAIVRAWTGSGLDSLLTRELEDA
jgi:hypothetical protein